MDVVLSVVSDQNFLGAIIASIAFILLGFLLRRLNFINEHGREILNVVVMKVAIPCMAFCAFMSDFNTDEFIANLLILVVGIKANFAFFVVELIHNFPLCCDASNRPNYTIRVS